VSSEATVRLTSEADRPDGTPRSAERAAHHDVQPAALPVKEVGP
jgi:hypothetical protein